MSGPAGGTAGGSASGQVRGLIRTALADADATVPQLMSTLRSLGATRVSRSVV